MTFARDKLELQVYGGNYGEPVYAACRFLGGPAILVTDKYEPGADFMIVMDKMEKFMRFVQDGISFEGAYLAAFPA